MSIKKSSLLIFCLCISTRLFAIDAVYNGENGIKDQVLTVCTQCHSSTLSGIARNGAPTSVNFDTYNAALASGDRAIARAVIAANMPPSGFTPLTTEQKNALTDWQTAGFPESATASSDTFDSTTGVLHMPVVVVGNDNYEVDMAHQGDLVFKVTTAVITTSSSSTPDTYDSASGLLSMPNVIVGSDTYNVEMIHQGNLVFKVTLATKRNITRSSVVDCSSLTSELSSEAVTLLVKYNYKKCAMVAGILIANSNETLLDGKDITTITQQQADILAEMLDNNQDGLIDDTKITSKLASGANTGAWLNIQSADNESNEETIVAELQPYIGKDMGVKNSWLLAAVEDNALKEKLVMTEEAIHMLHMLAYAKVYPAQFAVSDSGCTNPDSSSEGCDFNQSILTKLAWEAMSVSPIWYQHGENSQPSNGIVSGSCAQPSCAAIEFIMNVLVEYRSIYSHVSLVSMPSTKTAVEEKLNSTTTGQEMKAILDSTTYNQLLNGLSYTYSPTVK
jgi:hypothetical protein